MYTRDDISRIEEALGVEVPVPLQEFLLKLNVDNLSSLNIEVFSGADDLIDANAQIVVSDWFAHTDLDVEEYDSYLIFASDGCGNYFLLDPDDDDSNVWCLAHDPLALEDLGASIEEFIRDSC